MQIMTLLTHPVAVTCDGMAHINARRIDTYLERAGRDGKILETSSREIFFPFFFGFLIFQFFSIGKVGSSGSKAR